MDAAEYYKIRLQHTIEHLQQVTRLIYFVSGAIVGTLYFIFKEETDASTKRHLVVGLLVLLALVNLAQGALIIRQGGWYRLFDERLAKCVGVARDIRKAWLGLGARELHATVHWLVAVASLISAVYLAWRLGS